MRTYLAWCNENGYEHQLSRNYVRAWVSEPLDEREALAHSPRNESTVAGYCLHRWHLPREHDTRCLPPRLHSGHAVMAAFSGVPSAWVTRRRAIMPGMIHTSGIGVCEYRLSTEEKDVINARWVYSDAVEKGCTICRGRATGDTSNGFPGDYHVQYFGTEDELVGDFDLHIEPVGDAYRLTWRNRSDDGSVPGEIACEGFGFPTGDQSMVLTYWMAE